MSETSQKKPNVLNKIIATSVVLFILLIIVVVLLGNGTRNQDNAQRDAEIAQFLEESTPDISAEDQQKIIDSITTTEGTVATPEQEQAALDMLQGKKN